MTKLFNNALFATSFEEYKIAKTLIIITMIISVLLQVIAKAQLTGGKGDGMLYIQVIHIIKIPAKNESIGNPPPPHTHHDLIGH